MSHRADDPTRPPGPPDSTGDPPPPDATWGTNTVPVDRTELIEREAPPSVPGYDVVRELGRGGMGVVYEARQHGLNRTVALKMVLAGSRARADELVRFLAEAETAAGLHHHGIAQVFDTGRADGLPYFTMEFLDGGSLADRLRAGPLPPADAARVALQLAEAVAHAHAAGVIHRDLKPANILLAADGAPKITDFGLARRLEAGSGVTASGAVLGTPAYMPPEQARGDLKAVGPLGDVYALGAVLYECLTGRPPFRGENPVRTLALVLNEPPEKPRSVSRGVPIDLETIALKCLEKEPAKRYASAAALADDLRRFLDGRPITARRIGPGERLVRWARRNPVVAALLALVLVTSVTGAAVSLAFAARAADEAYRKNSFAEQLSLTIVDLEAAKDRALKHAADADAARRKADKSAADAVAARRDLAVTLADSYATLGTVAGERAEPGVGCLWFARAVRQSADDPDREHFNRVRLQNWSREAFVPVAAFQPKLVAAEIALHPGGRHLLLTGSYTPAERVWDIDREAAWATPDGFALTTAAAWSPDGSRVALAVGKGRVGVFEFPSGKAVGVGEWGQTVTVLRFSPDGETLAGGQTTVKLWDVGRRRFEPAEFKHPNAVRSVAFSPDGRRLLTGCADLQARVFDLAAADPTRPVLTTPHSPAAYPFTRVPHFADGGGVVIASPRYDSVKCVEVGSGKPRFEFRPASGSYTYPVSPDGKTVWVAEGENGRGVQPVEVATGKKLPFTLPHTNTVQSVAFSPDGRLVVTGSTDRTVCVSDAASGGSLMAPLPHASSLRAVAVGPDHRTLATVQWDGLVRVWRMPVGQPVRVVPTGVDYALARVVAGGKYVVPVGGSFFTAKLTTTALFDPLTGQPASGKFTPGGVVTDADVSPDGRVLATVTRPDAAGKTAATPAGTGVRLWDVGSGQPRSGLIHTPSVPRSVRFRPDGKQLAVLCEVGTLLVLDPADPVSARTFSLQVSAFAPTQYVMNGRAEYMPDGRKLLVYGPSNVPLSVCDPATGVWERRPEAAGPVYDARLSPDGAVVAVSGQKSVTQFLRPTSGPDPHPPLPHPDWTFSARFDRAGSKLLTACRDGGVRLWDWRAGKLLSTCRHADEVPAAEFLPDERFAVSVCYDGTLRLWAVAAGEPVGPPILTGGKALTLELTPDGRFAATAGFSNRITVADLKAMTTPAAGGVDDLILRAELASNQRISPAGQLAFLTSAEWMFRWNEYRRRNPKPGG